MTYQKLIDSISVTPFVVINLLILFLVGILVSTWTKKLTVLFFNRIRFDQALDRIGWKEFLKKADISLNYANLCGSIVQIFFILLFLMIGMEIVGLTLFFGFLEKLILYYPNIMISALIATASVYLIDFSQKIVVGTKTLNNITYSRLLSKLIDYSIRFMTFLAICYQLSIVPQFILIIFVGMIATITLSLGISLGLAAKEPMSRFLHEIKKTFSE